MALDIADKLSFARRMRERPTRAEALLWSHLELGRLGYLFDTQVLYYGWIVDFMCVGRSLIIEVDGASHSGQRVQDKIRDDLFKSKGWIVLRVTNREVLGTINEVLEGIDYLLAHRCTDPKRRRR